MAEVEIRSARDTDRDAVLAFCAHTWEWGDYIERVWDDWLHNPEGRMLVATSDEQPIGVGHLRMLNAHEAWLEGLRVDPKHRVQGTGTALNMALQAEAMQRAATHVRLLIESTNIASQRVVAHAHMRQVGGFASFRAVPQKDMQRRGDGSEQTLRAETADLAEIIDYLNASNVFPAVGGLYYAGFTAYAITDELLEEKIAAGQVYLLRRWERLDGLAIAEQRAEHDGSRLSIGYIDGMTIEAISLIAYDLRRRAFALEVESLYAYAPDLVLVRDGLAGIGYEWSGEVFYTYERDLY